MHWKFESFFNFDRVWENVAGDYGWTPHYSRNIAVDVRYILWVLVRVDGAAEVLAELGLSRDTSPNK